jgi:DNA-binding SARP family transcriptional activator/tetratricopeptide (TPR) repeat protein/TolB-like protein
MIELRTLGSLDLRAPDGREVRSVLAQPKRLALLVYLAVEAPGGFVRRDTLLGMFWPESDDQRARGALRQAVRYLRRSLGAETLVNRAEDELGIAAGALRCDATGFRQAIGRGDSEGALALYGGEFLEGFSVSGAPEFDRWLEGERKALRSEASAAAWSLADAAAGVDLRDNRGHGGEAPDDTTPVPAEADRRAARKWARRAVELAPWDEHGVRRLISLLEATGDRAGAVRAYEAFAKRLATHLELEPSPETTKLIEGVRGRGEAKREEPDRGPSTSSATATVGPDGTVHPPPRPPPVSGPPTVRRGFLRGSVVGAGLLAAAVVIVGGLVMWMGPPASEPPLDPRRVLVTPFENRTGESSLDPVASMTADWIVQGLAGRGALEVVPVTAVLASVRAAGALVDPFDPLPLARETGAGTVVHGSFYSQGDSIYLQARVVDATAGRLIAAIDPVGTAVGSPLDGIHGLRQRVLVALAPLSDDRETHVRLARSPPSYEAYRSYVTGFESFVHRDVPTALRHFERASLADSTFYLPAIAAAIMHMNLGTYVAADSVAHRVDRHRDDLGPLELATLDMVLGWLDGDQHRAWEASLRQARIAPGSIGEYQVAEQARRLNRPSETVEVLTRMGPERGELRGWFAFWRELTAANHMLGRHQEELRVARQARELYPALQETLFLEIRALAALGRADEIQARVAERMASSSRERPSAGALMVSAARELRAHGHREPADGLFQQSVEWYGNAGTAEDVRASLAIVLYEVGRWNQAGEIFQELAAEDPTAITPRAYLGVIAARKGERTEAERFDAWLRDLDQRYLWGTATLHRARISAALGDEDRAVDLLRSAFGEGLQHGTSHHLNVEFEALRDHPGFIELMRPR